MHANNMALPRIEVIFNMVLYSNNTLKIVRKYAIIDTCQNSIVETICRDQSSHIIRLNWQRVLYSLKRQDHPQLLMFNLN